MSADNKEIDYFEQKYEITDLGIIHYVVPHYKEDDIKFDIEPTYLDDKMPYKAESEDIGDYPDTISNQFDNMTGSMNL